MTNSRHPLWAAVLAVAACTENALPTAGSIAGPEPSSPPPPSASADGTASAATSAVAELAEGEERWGGRVEIGPNASLEFKMRIRPGERPTAKMAIPVQNLPPTELVGVTYTPTHMAFTLALPGVAEAAHAHFSVTRTPGERTAAGTMKQSGQSLPLVMKRLAEGESFEIARPQTPKPPFPYDAREASFVSSDGTKLAGTLTLPKRDGKQPAVVLVSGSGEQDRDSTLAGHKFFLVIADHLTRAGIAVLRVDDRGVGGSGGSTAQTGLDGKVDDALAGMGWLAAQAEIDAARIGLIGHSEGGLIAPLAAARPVAPPFPSVAFIVLLAGPGVPGNSLVRRQMADTLRAQGVTEARFKQGMAGQNKAVDAVMAGADDDAMRVIAEELVDGLLGLQTEAERTQLGFLGRRMMIETTFQQVASPAMRAMIRSDPGPTLEKVRCPVLALDGTLDLQVPADENLGGIAAALARGKNADVTTEALPGLNHLFQPAKMGTMEEWGTIETTIDPAVLEKVSVWVQKRARL